MKHYIGRLDVFGDYDGYLLDEHLIKYSPIYRSKSMNYLSNDYQTIEISISRKQYLKYLPYELYTIYMTDAEQLIRKKYYINFDYLPINLYELALAPFSDNKIHLNNLPPFLARLIMPPFHSTANLPESILYLFIHNHYEYINKSTGKYKIPFKIIHKLPNKLVGLWISKYVLAKIKNNIHIFDNTLVILLSPLSINDNNNMIKKFNHTIQRLNISNYYDNVKYPYNRRYNPTEYFTYIWEYYPD